MKEKEKERKKERKKERRRRVERTKRATTIMTTRMKRRKGGDGRETDDGQAQRTESQERRKSVVSSSLLLLLLLLRFSYSKFQQQQKVRRQGRMHGGGAQHALQCSMHTSPCVFLAWPPFSAAIMLSLLNLIVCSVTGVASDWVHHQLFFVPYVRRVWAACAPPVHYVIVIVLLWLFCCLTCFLFCQSGLCLTLL